MVVVTSQKQRVEMCKCISGDSGGNDRGYWPTSNTILHYCRNVALKQTDALFFGGCNVYGGGTPS